MIDWGIYKFNEFLLYANLVIEITEDEKDIENPLNEEVQEGIRKVFQDIGFIGISRILTSVSGIIFLPFITKALGASGYGLWVQAMATVGLSLPLLRLGLPVAMARIFPEKDDIDIISEDFISIVIFISLLSLSFIVFLFIFTQPLADAIFENNTTVVKIVSILIFVSILNYLFKSFFRAFRNMKIVSILSVSAKYVGMILAIILLISGFGLIAILLGIVINRTFFVIIQFYLISKKINFRFPKLKRAKEYLNYGLPTIPQTLSHWVVSTSDRYIIGIFLGSTFVGYYSPGYTIGKAVPWMIGGVLSFVLTPNLSKYYKEGREKKLYR